MFEFEGVSGKVGKVHRFDTNFPNGERGDLARLVIVHLHVLQQPPKYYIYIYICIIITYGIGRKCIQPVAFLHIRHGFSGVRLESVT